MTLNINGNTVNSGNQAGGHSSVQNTAVSQSIKNALLSDTVREGHYFNGKIQDIIGNQVKIIIGRGELLQATLENGIGFNIGDEVNFFVKENSGAKILLQAVELPQMNGLGSSLTESLEQLGLSMNDRNIAMVKEMMAYNMPLNQETLASMERLINTYTGTEAATIVSMVGHNIQVNENNIAQFQAYQSYENKITENMSELSSRLEALAKDNPELMRELTGVLGEGTVGGYESEPTVNMSAYGNEIAADTGSSGNMAASGNIAAGEAYNASSLGNVPEGAVGNAEAYGNVPEGAAGNTEALGASAVFENEAAADTENSGKAGESGNRLTDEANALKGSVLSKTEDGSVVLKNNAVAEQTGKTLSSLAKLLKGRWMIDSDLLEGKSGEEVKRLVNDKIQSMYRDSERIMETLKNNGMEKTDAYKAAENIKNSLSFMNDMSHMASYIQVPYRTYEGEANGELFVYNKNKNKTLEDGPITAFLHLDLEHLGATDVKVTMDASSRVTTKFTLADTVSQDIVEENLPWLKARLENLGYTAEITCEVMEKAGEIPFNQILEVDRPKNQVKRYGFDIRL